MAAAVVDHLWQSSVFLLLAWGMASLLRRNGAHVRFWIWFAASVKFLVPFSLFAFLGRKIGSVGMDVPAYAHLTVSVQEIAVPLFSPAASISSTYSPGSNWIQTVLLTLWAVGSCALILRWVARWREVWRIVKSAVPVRLVAPIPILSSSTSLEPGVFGIRRPVLMLPESIVEALSPKQLQAIIDHELCHVRRGDNLTTLIHMLVEAVFWFHPAVWWLGSRLLHERERACDEAVVRKGHDPLDYAEGILGVCRHYLASNLACVAGVSGADLELRLEAIMRNEAIIGVSLKKRFVLGAAASVALAVPLLVGLCVPSTSEAQASTNQVAPSAAAARTVKVRLLDGKRVKLHFQNADVRALIVAIAEAARVNILVSDKVGGTVTVDLAEMPWEQALTIVLRANGLAQREKDGIIFIEPAADSGQA